MRKKWKPQECAAYLLIMCVFQNLELKKYGKNREIIGNISTGLDTIQQRPKRQNSYNQAMGYQTSKRVDGKIKSSS